MINFKCDNCKKVIGKIDKNAHICAFDAYVGIEKLCSKCYKKGDTSYWKKSNDLLE